MKQFSSKKDASSAPVSITPPPDVAKTWFQDPNVAARMSAYAEILLKWQRRINLVSKGTLPDLWRRHFADSAQLFALIPPGTEHIVDFGSGAGFPGLVLAAMGPWRVSLIESDSRKCAFLSEASRVMGLNVTIHNARIDAVPALNADVATARALAGLPDLLAFTVQHLRPSGIALFLKGQMAEEELTLSLKQWNMVATRTPSHTDPSGVILQLGSISPRHGRCESDQSPE